MTMTKPLTGKRRIAIAKGESELPYLTVDSYLRRWKAQGYTLPEFTGELKPESTAALSSVGTCLYEIIKQKTGKDVDCDECKKDILALNRLSWRDAKKEKSKMVDNIYHRAWKFANWSELLKLYASEAFSVATGDLLSPAKLIIGGWFDLAVTKGKIAPVQKKRLQQRPGPRFHAGARRPKQYKSLRLKASKYTLSDSADPVFRIVTAVRTSYRDKPTLGRTIKSIEDGGFESPVVFAEPNAPEDEAVRVRWDTQLKPFKSFVKMSEWLLKHLPDQWYLLCEDDIEMKVGVADYLRGLNLKKENVMSLYVSAKQTEAITEEGVSDMKGDVWGSLAYLIHASQLRRVLESKTFRNWKMPDRMDRVFCNATRELSIPFLFHSPSLVQHTGETSTLIKTRKMSPSRVSENFNSSRHETGLVTLITPTGDRHKAFQQCEKWISDQRYSGEIQWIVVDDGRTPTECTMGQTYIRERPMEGHSLSRNLRAAYPHIKGEHIFVIEDDDYYGPDYLSVMVGRLQHADLVGEFGAKYYYIQRKMWRHNHGTEKHASLCRTGMNKSVMPCLWNCIHNTDHPSVDLRLWSEWAGSAFSWKDTKGDSRMCVGIKGVEGRQSYGWRPSPNSRSDPDLHTLQLWVGEGFNHYSTLTFNNKIRRHA